MKMLDICDMPQTIDHNKVDARGIHESVFRSTQILHKTIEWLEKGVPSDVILSLIDEMQNAGEA